MIPTPANRAFETSTTTGTGSYTLAGAVTGYQTFSAAIGNVSTVYAAFDVDGNGNPSGGWEVGEGTLSGGTTLSRDRIVNSSNSNNAVNWGGGTRRVMIGGSAHRHALVGGAPSGPQLYQNWTVTSRNAGDTDDASQKLVGTLSVSSASDALIWRHAQQQFTNSLTGGGHLQYCRMNEIGFTGASGSVTDNLDYYYVYDNATAGSVGTARGIYVDHLPGTARVGFNVGSQVAGGGKSALLLLGDAPTSIPSGTHWSVYSPYTYPSHFGGQFEVVKAAVSGENNLFSQLDFSATGYPNHVQNRSLCNYVPTSIADPFTIGHYGFHHTVLYGDVGGVAVNPTASSGSAIAYCSSMLIRDCSQYESEHSPLLLQISYDNNNNALGNTTPGRGWMADLDMFSCVNMQQSAFGGVHLFAGNYFNGPPRDALTTGFAFVGNPGSGAATDAYHIYGRTYQMGAGYTCTGFSNGGVTRIVEAAFRAGGEGTNWQVGADQAHIATGLDASDFDQAALIARGRFSGIYQIDVTNAGSGFTSQPTVAITGGGATVAANATAELVATTVSRTASTNLVTQPGGGYAANEKALVTYSTPTPWGQVACGYVQADASGNIAVGSAVVFSANASITATTSGGAITSLATIAGTNTGYPPSQTALPVVFEQSGNRTAWGTATTNSSGSITAVAIQAGIGKGSGYSNGSVNIENTGCGYTRNPTASAAGPAGGGGFAPTVGTVPLAATTVDIIKLATLGLGYTSQPTVSITGGGGGGGTALAYVLSMCPLPEVNVTTTGSGYTATAAPAVTVGTTEANGGICVTSPHPTATVTGGVITALGGTATGGTGFLKSQTPGFVVKLVGQTSGARNAKAVVTTDASGVVATATLIAGGSGYTSGETLHYVGDVAVYPVIQNGLIVDYVMTDLGAGYVSAPTVTVAAPSPTTATGTSTATAGSLASVTMTNKGTAYWSGAPTVQFWTSGGTAGTTGGLTTGTAPAPTATVSSGVITALGGTATGGTGYVAGQTFTARLVGQTSNASNATVSLTTNGSGVITAATLLTGGSGYTSGETLRYVGLGSGHAVVYFGVVDRVVIDVGGAGYNANPSVVFSAPPGGSTATASATGRFGGHALVLLIGAGAIYQESGNPSSPNRNLLQTVDVALAADVTTTNTTATDVSSATAGSLSFTIGPYEVWDLEVHLKIGSSSTAGTKYAVNFPSGCTVAADVKATTTGNAAFAYERMSVATTLTTTAFNTTGAITTAAVGAFADIRGIVRNGATAGTVVIQHAKVTSGTSTVYANSLLKARRIA